MNLEKQRRGNKDRARKQAWARARLGIRVGEEAEGSGTQAAKSE